MAFEEVAVLVDAQQRIAKHARRERRRAPRPFLAAQLCGVSKKVVPLKLHAGHDLKAHLLGALEHPLERLARAGWACGVPSALTNSPKKKGTSSSHGTWRAVFRSSRAVASGKPCCQPVMRGVVVSNCPSCPSPAPRRKSQSPPLGQGLGNAQELVAVQVLAAQHAIDVADRDLDALRARLADGRDGGMFLGCGLGSVVIVLILVLKCSTKVQDYWDFRHPEARHCVSAASP